MLREKTDDMDEGRIILVCLWLLGMVFLVGESAEVRLTQERPCLTGQSTRLRCSVTSGTNVDGLFFHQDGTLVVYCPPGSPLSCRVSLVTQVYNLTMEGVNTSYLDIQMCDDEFIGLGNWTCSDGEHGNPSRVQVIVNTLPTGILMYNSTCGPGGVNSPAFLSCSGLRPGVPPATLSITDSSNQTVDSSQTGSVTGTVTRGGQASCSVMWSAFPSFPHNISPIFCVVQVVPSIEVGSGGPRTVRDRESVTLTCDSRGYPRPTFTWSREGLKVISNVSDTVTRGSLTFTANKGGGDKQTVNCTSSNSAGQDSASFTINVIYPPEGAPNLTKTPPGVVYKDDIVTVTCKVTGGNPLVSNVTVTCSRHSNTSQGDVSRLEFTADSGDQGSCVCSAFHVLGYSLTASLSLQTFYPPAFPTLTPSVTFPWFEGNQTTLTCTTSDSGLPAARVQWLEGHGGVAVSDSVLEYRPVQAEDDGRSVRCNASNNYTLTKADPRVSSTNITVHYFPRVSLFPSVDSGPLTLTEDVDVVNLTCSARGNPPPSTPQWGPGGGSRLTFDPITRHHHGVYNCTATSSSFKFGELTSSVLVNISVRFAPNVSVLVSGDGNSRTLMCEAEGRPSTYMFWPWIQYWGSQEVRRVPVPPSGGHSSLTLTSYQDSGTYSCSVSNGVLDRQGQLIVNTATVTPVQVEDLPQVSLPSTPAVQFGEIGEESLLYVTLFSWPQLLNFTWHFQSVPVSNSTAGFSTTNSSANVTLPVHSHNLTVLGLNVTLSVVLDRNQSGDYLLEACNRIGCSIKNVTLQPAGPPLPPENLRGIPGVDSVVLSWEPGFPGGDYFQWFHLQYRGPGADWTSHSTSNNRSSADERTASQTVTGLQPGTTYEFRVQAQNTRPRKNLSTFISISVETLSSPKSDLQYILGGVFGAAGLLILIFLAFCLVKRFWNARGMKDPPLHDPANGEPSNGVENPALEDNPLYESSQAFHPILEENPLYESSAAALVKSAKEGKVKQSKKPTAPVVKNEENAYAVVTKKTKKTAGKGDVYENVELSPAKSTETPYSNTEDKVYANACEGATSCNEEKVGNQLEREIHDDGCVYITVESSATPNAKSSKPPKVPKKPETDAFKDDAVIYSEVDHTKKAPVISEDGAK